MESNLTPEVKTFDVFISYSRKDTKIADRICEAFDKAGIRYFIDRKGIAGGGHFPEILANSIKDSRVFLFLGSKNSYESSYVDKEINFANNVMPKDIIPYLIDNTQMPISLQFMFSNLNCRNIKEHPIETALVQDVLSRIKKNPVEIPVPKKTANHSQASNRAKFFSNVCSSFVGLVKEKPVVSGLILAQIAAIIVAMVFASQTIGNAFIAKLPHLTGWWTSLWLIILFAAELISTILIFCDRKKAFYTTCILDIAIVVLLGVLSMYVYAHKRSIGINTGSELYLLGLNMLGHSLTKITLHKCIYALFAPIHVAIMYYVLKIKHAGKSAWELMK